MRASKLVEISECGQLTPYSRIFSNWHRTRGRLEGKGHNPTLHRISAKRVFIEVVIPSSKFRGSARVAASKIVLPAGSKKLGRVVVAWVVAVGLAITLAAIIPAVFVPDSLQNKSANGFTKESSSQQCVALEASSGLIVADLSEFAIVGWSVSTFGEMKKIGSIWFTSFEAKCQLQTIVGRVTANSRESGFQLLSLSTSYIFG